MMAATSSQTIGPYWHLIDDPAWSDLTRMGAAGPPITIEGRVTDGANAPVGDAAIELFQASPETSETFPGYGRVRTDPDGQFRFATIMPGPLPGPAGALANIRQAPHCGLAILARGLLKPLFTRIYFPAEALNETDPILALIEPVERRATLIARLVAPHRYLLAISLQGGAETVFLEF